MSKGTKTQRAVNSFISISPAVVHGGVSTFLAVIPIGAFSNSHASITFFRTVSFTVLFGLYHGILFLPVVFTFLGADNADDEEIQMDTNTKSTSEQTRNHQSGEVNKSFNSNDESVRNKA